ncbi:MAG: D-alanyl-D-alanine carboxypeptidase/D-alanyl-D-alanine-endopeptidase [Chloroherpetonaceae bacterium]|nr:D-alanyl-D-alanine carboxypeptidase/D-alanyl-D-alanine-endopeptidase [Chloroherpetonaceae bacterium]MDW8438044.1 D-alanyl-D-alanine carboxypeptidase/D-alanyl-D-alanine-endopeptidase [Chloroherpetonaceae bacterium]
MRRSLSPFRLNVVCFFLLVASLLWLTSPLFALGGKKRGAERIALSGLTEAERMSECAEKIARELRSKQRGFGVLIQTASGVALYSLNSNRLFKPASNIKLITSAVAIEKLKPDFRYRTEFFIDGEIAPDGVLHGNLIVSGSPDPILSGFFDQRINDIVLAWIDTLRARGISAILGDLILDNSYYFGNDVSLAKQDSYKPLEFFTVANFRNADVKQLSKARVRRYRVIKLKNGKTRKVAYYRRRARLRKVIVEPNAYMMEVLMQELQKRQMIAREEVKKIAYSTTLDRTKWKHIYTHFSEPLSELLKIINKHSDNFYADQLLRALGGELRGDGSIEKGLDVVREFLIYDVGASPDEFYLADGSGLSHANLVTPELLVKVLRYMRARSPHFVAYYESLSIPTVDGTLGGRIHHELAKNIRAKTGSISGVISLSGYLTSRSGQQIYFSIIGNNVGKRRAKATEDRICKYLLEI